MVHRADLVAKRQFNREIARIVQRFESLARRHSKLAKHVRNLANGRQYYTQKTKPRYRKFTVQKAVRIILKEMGLPLKKANPANAEKSRGRTHWARFGDAGNGDTKHKGRAPVGGGVNNR